MISKIYKRKVIERLRGGVQDYTVFEDQKGNWYIASCSLLAELSKRYNNELKAEVIDDDLINNGPGRMVSDFSQAVRLIDLVRENSDFFVKFNNGKKIQASSTEIKTLLLTA